MSIQTTRFLTRTQAFDMLAYRMVQKEIKRLERLKKAELEDMTDEELEDALEETFYNYSILPDNKENL